jgi:hypothetical protein
MPFGSLKPTATIRDVQSTLEKPEEYVRVVLEHLMGCKRQHGSARVRIGITGMGKVPYHKIVYDGEDGAERLFGAYDGQHRFPEVAPHDHAWSSVHMTVEDVRGILGELRTITGRP